MQLEPDRLRANFSEGEKNRKREVEGDRNDHPSLYFDFLGPNRLNLDQTCEKSRIQARSERQQVTRTTASLQKRLVR